MVFLIRSAATPTARSAAWLTSSRSATLTWLIDVAPRLLEQPIALGGGRRANARFFRGDLLRALRAQRFELAGKRLHLSIDLFDLRRGRLFHLSGVDEIAADLRAAIVQIRRERRPQQVDERADEDREVDEPGDDGQQAFGFVFGFGAFCMFGGLLRFCLARRFRGRLRFHGRRSGRSRGDGSACADATRGARAASRRRLRTATRPSDAAGRCSLRSSFTSESTRGGTIRRRVHLRRFSAEHALDDGGGQGVGVAFELARAASAWVRSRTEASPIDRSTSRRVAATSSARVASAARRFSSI